ncbi:hypothetical protein SDC9_162159 [bioreactor metagenome]|uniref:Uncharacterized protein n=1 Tax=bioreactor metagenome TaxID=1076179 RepID=A0A645FLL9_9ZZZZ
MGFDLVPGGDGSLADAVYLRGGALPRKDQRDRLRHKYDKRRGGDAEDENGGGPRR